MKRFVIRLIPLINILSGLTLITGPVLSQAKDNEDIVEIEPVYIDVRSGPGRGYPVFHALERDEEVQVLKSRTDWVKVKTQNRYEAVTGWVRQNDLFDKGSQENTNNSRWFWSAAMGDFDGAQNLDISLGYELTRYLEAEINYGQATGDFSDIDYAYLKINSSFRQLWSIRNKWKANPYFSIGAGQLTTTPNTKLVQSEQRSDASMLAGIGLRSYLTRNFFMRLEYNQHLVLTDRESNEDVDQWLFGLTVHF